MSVDFEPIEFGMSYERPFLAKLWGYQSYHAISKGVITPANSQYIILFVTKEKQGAFPQYNDYIDGNLLFWEGEEKHSSDRRIVNAAKNKDEIHLFYRDTHHTPFIYWGKVSLMDCQLKDNAPSEFIFAIESFSTEVDLFQEVRAHAEEYKTLAETEREQIIVSRLGQGDFRRNVIRLWGSCSVTGLPNINLLRASHIKPWKDSNNQERLDPYNGFLLTPDLDFLFDRGYISFTKNGVGLVSKRLDPFARQAFKINDELCLRKVFPRAYKYLEFHQDAVFK